MATLSGSADGENATRPGRRGCGAGEFPQGRADTDAPAATPGEGFGSMRFHINSAAFCVAVADAPLHDPGGGELDAQVHERRRLILLSPDLPAELRLHRLLHELRHVAEWCGYAAGQARPVETECDAYADLTVQVIRQLEAQGGEIALRMLGHTGATLPRVASPRSDECGQCNQMVAPGSVVGRLVHHPTLGTPAIWRTLYCDGCGHLQRWYDLPTATGAASGVMMGAATFERDPRKVAAWLRKHPVEAGVVTV